jgi:CDP-diacylglycerol--glycerol-3-phosphate 3-phosphatidyltransferase
MKHVPNALTIARIVVTPVLFVLLFSDSLVGYAWALGLFVFAAISDYFDGSLARRYSVGTSLGQYLDPFADKILVLGTFAALIFVLPHTVSVWAVGVIALRDVAVTALRTYLKMRGGVLRTSWAAKAKTTVQLTFLILTLLLLTLSRIPGAIGSFVSGLISSPLLVWLLWIVVLVTVATGVDYFVKSNRSASVVGSENSIDS